MLTVSSTEVLGVHRCIQDSIPQPVVVPVDKKHNSVNRQQAAPTVDGICNSPQEADSLPQGEGNENKLLSLINIALVIKFHEQGTGKSSNVAMW